MIFLIAWAIAAVFCTGLTTPHGCMPSGGYFIKCLILWPFYLGYYIRSISGG